MLKGKTLYAYLGGIIDGEGTITLHTHKSGNSTAYMVNVSVANTSEWLMSFLKMQFGGRIYLKPKRNSKEKDCWMWTIACGQARDLLRLCIPFIFLKKPQAELAIRYQSRRSRGHRTHNERVLDEADKVLMLSYNKRGV